MEIWLRKLFLLFFAFLSFGLKAQIEDKKKAFVSKKSIPVKEDKNTLALYDLYNKGEEKKAYKKAHLILKSKADNRPLARTNLLLAYYFNKRAEIKSQALLNWLNGMKKSISLGLSLFSTISRTIMNHYQTILNYFDNRSTNASAE
ncbi:transposase [Flavobacterium hungaricum]|uniref:transposase n=1 Tax=Flavobacterium hungaricum TaxID=2082725 RepID=UPI00187FFD5D|nr:transposase [Flavobacterium hungaricum]